LLDHLQKDVGLREELFDLGCGMGIGRSGVVAAEGLLLRADHALCSGDIVGARRGCEADQKCENQNERAHAKALRSTLLATVQFRNLDPRSCGRKWLPFEMACWWPAPGRE